MKHFSKLLLVFFSLLLPFNVFGFEFSFGKKYLDYGNGAINLDLVTHISPSWDYKYTHPGTLVENYLDKYHEVPDKNNLKNRIKELFDYKLFETLDFYYISNNSSIKFDDFTLTILPETIYFKIPDCSLIKTKNEFIKFSLRVMEEFEIDNNSEGACQKLEKRQNKLTKEGILQIENGLLDTIVTYSKVVTR